MNKTVKKVFMLIGLLVIIFIAWQLTFNDGGILRTMYNNIANGINTQWAKVAGSGQELLPVWNSSTATTNGAGFDIKTK
jgi:Na+/proline symporter